MKTIIIALALFASPLLHRWAAAQTTQPPPHAPGSVCYTPHFWCWAQPPGLLGSPCACLTPYGWVSGVRG